VLLILHNPKLHYRVYKSPPLHLSASDKTTPPYAILRLHDTIKFIATANSLTNRRMRAAFI